MDDRLDTFEILALDAANVLADVGHRRDRAPREERAALIEIAVEAYHFVARLQQHRNHDGSDVSQMPGHHDAHCCSPSAWSPPGDPLLHRKLSGMEGFGEAIGRSAFHAA